jgi:hypothetical protein
VASLLAAAIRSVRALSDGLTWELGKKVWAAVETVSRVA